jgi:methylthioribose-1-phosphate isomerase
MKSGTDIPLKQRNPSEVTTIHGSHPVAPKDVAVYNPAFGVTPAELITAIIIERGIFKPGDLAPQFQST